MLTQVSKKYSFSLRLYDLICIVLSIFLAPVIRFQSFSVTYFSYKDYYLLIIVAINMFILYLFDFYSIKVKEGRFQIVVNFILAYLVAGTLIAWAVFLLPNVKYGRGIWGLQIGLSFFLTGLGHLLFYTIARSHLVQKRVLLIGQSEKIDKIAKLLEEEPVARVIGYVGKQNSKVETNFLGGIRKFDDIIAEQLPELLIVVDKKIISREFEQKLLQFKMDYGHIYDLPALFETLFQKIPVNFINDVWLIFSTFRGMGENEYNRRFKRIMDILLSIIGLTIASPIVLLAALAIIIESPGGVFYRQVRVGLNEKHFKIIKLRSMVSNAEKDGAVWAAKSDSRVTAVGKFIRKTRIDEIPQLWNVLKGEMTLIGPRPERPEFVEMLQRKIPYYSLRHMIKPGISGWAQINYPYGASVEDAMQKLEFDLYYMRHLNLSIDINIIFRTARTVVFGHGAR